MMFRSGGGACLGRGAGQWWAMDGIMTVRGTKEGMAASEAEGRACSDSKKEATANLPGLISRALLQIDLPEAGRLG